MLTSETSSLASLRHRYLRGEADPVTVLDSALARANSNAHRNVYLQHDPAWSRAEATRLRTQNIAHQPLWGLPVSLKDCFHLAGFHTSCGSAFYRDHHGIAAQDSAVAARLRSAGAVLTGKTHLHQLAYGITGENRDFGDCLQPRDATRLTGGSSSGAAASVQEGSALAAIGTDTGGSIRVPAALCGLSGYRSSLVLQHGLWEGGAHLAPSFDTLGWLYPDLADGPLLAHALFGLPLADLPAAPSLRIGLPHAAFLHDCDPDVAATLRTWQRLLLQQGATLQEFDTGFCSDAVDLFAHIQAAEAAALHRGHFDHFEPAIVERLAWGASITAHELDALRHLLALFRDQISALFDRFDYLLLPCAPMSSLAAHADHSTTRTRTLRYTAPISLAGLPVVVLPGQAGALQLVGRSGSDADLLALGASLAPFAPNPVPYSLEA